MAVDIYNTRRTHYHKCRYWLRNENIYDDDDTLVHNKKPDGIFYARDIENISKDTRELNNVWQYDYDRLRLETTDIVKDLDKNALVEFEDKIYLVDAVEIKHIHKRHEFGKSNNSITYIYLRG